MASISATFNIFFTSIVTISLVKSTTLHATLVEDLVNLQPPPDFNKTLAKNCMQNPSHRYCNAAPTDLNEIFKSTIVASYLCNESNNPNCIDSFPKIDLRNNPSMASLYLSLDLIFFWKYCPISILSIDLSSNSLTGSFPTYVMFCTQIQSLDISHNRFSGDFPVHDFSALTNLTFLNLSYNEFSEIKISDSQYFQRFSSSSFIHSGLFQNHATYTIKFVIFIIVFPVFVILVVGLLWWLCFVRPDYLPRMCRRNHMFTTWMIKAATNGYSKKNLVMKSDQVSVYKGILRDGTDVKIEIYWNTNISSEIQSNFVEECKVFVQLRHKNLLQVFGWCNNRRMRAIVSEWTDGVNVEFWLSEPVPPWKQRLRLLIGVVEGMYYLQEEWPEIEYELNTSTVLLSDDLEPLISTFNIIEDQNNSITNTYNFGVFLLEIITNRRPREEFEQGEEGFVEFMKMHYPGNLREVIDAKMKVTESIFDQAKHLIRLALMCTDELSGQLPSLSRIYKTITRLYESCPDATPENHRRSHSGEGYGYKHKHVQFT